MADDDVFEGFSLYTRTDDHVGVRHVSCDDWFSVAELLGTDGYDAELPAVLAALREHARVCPGRPVAG